jgi:hypothetical protein
VRPPRTSDETATDAAHIITRIAIALLLIVAPIASVATRRAIYVLVPVGVALTLVAWLLDPGGRGPRQLRSALFSKTGLVLMFFVTWAGLSLIWTPFGTGPSERFVKSLATVVLAATAAALLPERTKTSNLYLLPIGVAAGAIAIVALSILSPVASGRPFDLDVSVRARAAFGVALLVWPALGALMIREKTKMAIALGVAVVIAELAAGVPLALSATAFGALAFAGALANSRVTARVAAIVGAALFFLAPIAAYAIYKLVPPGSTPLLFAPAISWGDILAKDGLRTLLGHGFDAARLGVSAGYLHFTTPRSVLFESWFELGIIGAVAAAILWAYVVGRAGRASTLLSPFLVAGLTAAFVMCAFGIGIAPVWWVTLLALDGFAFALLQHGHARTRRLAVADLPARS